MFILRNEKEQEHLKQLLPHIDQETLNTIIASIEMIRTRSNVLLNEQVHVALTDHILFALTRLKKGMAINNPFLAETKALYPFEYEIAAEVVEFINQSLDTNLPDGEIGFIALHVHSAITNKDISDINKYSQLVKQMMDVIEDRVALTIDREGIDDIGYVRRIRYTNELVVRDDEIEAPTRLASSLKKEYPKWYASYWKIIKIMHQALQKPLGKAEAVYLPR